MRMYGGARACRDLRVVLAVVATAGFLAHPAGAVVVLGNSQAEGAPATLHSVAVDGADVGSFGLSPPAYNVSNSLVSYDNPGVLTTGAIQTTAFSDVDGGPGSRTTGATVTAASTSFLGRFTVGAVTASASVSGDLGAFTSLASATIASLTIDGIPYDTSNPAPNTVIYNQGGTKVTLNEQLVQTDGTSFLAITETAVDIEVFEQTAASGVLIGNTLAIEVADIPEPASAVLLAGAALGLMVSRRARAT